MKKEIRLLLPLCATAFYAYGNTNNQICEDKSGDEAGAEAQHVIDLLCADKIDEAVNYMSQHQINVEDFDGEQIEWAVAFCNSKLLPIEFFSLGGKFFQVLSQRKSHGKYILKYLNEDKPEIVFSYVNREKLFFNSLIEKHQDKIIKELEYSACLKFLFCDACGRSSSSFSKQFMFDILRRIYPNSGKTVRTLWVEFFDEGIKNMSFEEFLKLDCEKRDSVVEVRLEDGASTIPDLAFFGLFNVTFCNYSR